MAENNAEKKNEFMMKMLQRQLSGTRRKRIKWEDGQMHGSSWDIGYVYSFAWAAKLTLPFSTTWTKQWIDTLK